MLIKGRAIQCSSAWTRVGRSARVLWEGTSISIKISSDTCRSSPINLRILATTNDTAPLRATPTVIFVLNRYRVEAEILIYTLSQ